jgi:hypothetical protein
MQHYESLEAYVDSSWKNKIGYSVFKFKEIEKYFVVENKNVPSSSDAEFVGITNICNYVIHNYPNIKELKIVTDSQSAKNTFFRSILESNGISKRIQEALNLKEIFINLNINLDIQFQFRNTCKELSNCDHIARMYCKGKKNLSFVDYDSMQLLYTEDISDNLQIKY